MRFLVEESDTRENVKEVLGSSCNERVTQIANVIVKNHAFDKAVLCLIVSNAAWIGIDVDWNDGAEGTVASMVFMFVESAFCFVFTLEIILRILTFKSKIQFLKDPSHWKSNIFDFFLVLMMILETWVLPAFSTGTNLNQFSLIRLLRLLRLVRIGRIFSMVPELGMMVKCLYVAARSVTSTLVLEIGIMYIVGVIFTQWAKEHDNPCFAEVNGDTCFVHEYFGTITKSLVTLLQILVFDNTFVIIRPILSDTWYMGLLLILFMLVGSWTVLNMLIGIICDIICTGTAEEKNKILEHRVKEVFSCIDVDGSGTVSRDEFERNGGQLQLMKLGISEDIVKNAFDILDCDSSGSFDVSEFSSMIFKLLHPPQSQDIQVLNQKISAIAANMNIQTFTSHSCRRLNKRSLSSMGSLSRMGPDVPCEEIVVRSDPDHKSQSYDEVTHDLRNSAREPDSDLDNEIPNNAWHAPMEPHTTPNKAWGTPTQGNSGCKTIDVVEGYTSVISPTAHVWEDHHPFAPEDDSSTVSSPASKNCSTHSLFQLSGCKSLMQGNLCDDSTDPEVVVAQLERKMVVSESQQKDQAHEVYKTLRQLVESADKVEEALALVHGTKLWDDSNHDKVDSLLKDSGLLDSHSGGTDEDENPFEPNAALSHQDQLSAQQFATLFSPKRHFSPPMRMMLYAYGSRMFRQSKKETTSPSAS